MAKRIKITALDLGDEYTLLGRNHNKYFISKSGLVVCYTKKEAEEAFGKDFDKITYDPIELEIPVAFEALKLKAISILKQYDINAFFQTKGNKFISHVNLPCDHFDEISETLGTWGITLNEVEA